MHFAFKILNFAFKILKQSIMLVMLCMTATYVAKHLGGMLYLCIQLSKFVRELQYICQLISILLLKMRNNGEFPLKNDDFLLNNCH